MEHKPYDTPEYMDCAPQIQAQLDALAAHGGLVRLDNRSYSIHQPVTPDASSLCFAGEVWACNTDPNGVFETDHGTKLRMWGRDFPAIRVGSKADPISGMVVRDLGVQGDIIGMDTRPLVDFAHPARSAGLCLDSVRTDQCEFSKLSFCGCANAVCACGDSEIDACMFSRLNVDGCGNGFWLAPRASFYAHVRSCVVADNPYYGFYAEGKGRIIHNLDLSDCIFIRSGGAFVDGDGRIPAAVLFDHISNCAVDRCLFDDPGTHWYFADHAGKNDQRQPSYRKTVALYIIGDANRITGNTFLHSSDDAICVEGDGNVLLSNISDGSVRITGSGNTVVNQVFTTPDARLILQGAAASTTTVVGVPEERILRC